MVIPLQVDVDELLPQDEKMFISREASPIFPNLNCVYMYKNAKFPPKFQSFPPHINISREWASQIPHFFSPWLLHYKPIQVWISNEICIPCGLDKCGILNKHGKQNMLWEFGEVVSVNYGLQESCVWEKCD